MGFLDSPEQFIEHMKEVDIIEMETLKDSIKRIQQNKHSNWWWFIHPNDEKKFREALKKK